MKILGCAAPFDGESAEVPGCETPEMPIAAKLTIEKQRRIYRRLGDVSGVVTVTPSGLEISENLCVFLLSRLQASRRICHTTNHKHAVLIEGRSGEHSLDVARDRLSRFTKI